MIRYDNEQVGTLASVTDADLAALVAMPAARALFDDITSSDTGTPDPGRALRRTVLKPSARQLAAGFVAAAAAVLVGVALLGGSRDLKPRTVMSPVAFQATQKGYIVARVTNPYATATSLSSAFRRQGLNMTVRLLPVSPSMVGTIEAEDVRDGNSTSIQPVLNGSCVTGGGACPIAIRIARGFSGSAEIDIGRPAKPEETYSGSADPTAPGEAFHCAGLYGSTIRQVLPLLGAKGFTSVTWMTDTISASGHPLTIREPMPPASNYVRAASLEASNRIMIWTTAGPSDRALVAAGNPRSRYERALNRGCPPVVP
jgi:hypothetical protein